MCMQPAAWPEPDPLIAAAIAAKYSGKRPRPMAVQVRDRLGQWLAAAAFAAAVAVDDLAAGGEPGRPFSFAARLRTAPAAWPHRPDRARNGGTRYRSAGQ